MSNRLLHFITQYWKLMILCFIAVDFFVAVGLLYFFTIIETERMIEAQIARAAAAVTPTVTPTATPWPGPGRRITPTPLLPPSPTPTGVLSESGFPPGFTPTPRPTPEQVMIKLPYIMPAFRVDSPAINQIYYPEPFFPAGTNNACGPVALFAALQGLGANVPYSHLRNIAVNNGFTSYGITKWGMINTITTINQELNNPYVIEQGNDYRVTDLIKQLRQGGVVIVLLRVKRENGEFRVTADTNYSFGHFLIVEGINLRSKTVRFAGSTLGMDKVPLADFLESWGSNPQALSSDSPVSLRNFLKNEKAMNWALIIKNKP